ncbi:hypothetical protein [Ornithinibacillus xuwenensis]|uniref:DUF4367 domain-containing protein n=1 Tax=Ornithinibacillus xuwenensis TaxID=3144668 RepID=A0ABU9XLP2_9BACI
MPKSTYSVVAVLFVFIIVISVFTYKSEDTIIQQAKETAENTFLHEDIPAENYQGEHLSFYLPGHMEVTEVDANNAILKNGDQTLIVFVNTLENNLSKLNFNEAQTEEAVLLESFENDEKFGYIRLLPTKDDKDVYEIQVGVGGVKITTYTEKTKVIEDTENLMQTALSIAK